MKEGNKVVLLKDKQTACYQVFKGTEGRINEVETSGIRHSKDLFWVRFLGQRRLIPCRQNEIKLKEE